MTMSVVTRIKFETAKVNSDKSVMAAMEKQVCALEGGAETTCVLGAETACDNSVREKDWRCCERGTQAM